MADLSSLIRLHKHELDEKRRALSELYGELATLEREIRDLERAFEAEKAAVSASGDIHFTFAGYVEAVAAQRTVLEQRGATLEKKIEAARDDMMTTFTELKKYQMTQDERQRLEAEERAFKDAQNMDAIGLEGFRRKNGEGEDR